MNTNYQQYIIQKYKSYCKKLRKICLRMNDGTAGCQGQEYVDKPMWIIKYLLKRQKLNIFLLKYP